jgi:hypothetical protein
VGGGVGKGGSPQPADAEEHYPHGSSTLPY